MSVYDKELIIDGKAVRSPEQQVYKNMKDIKDLQEIIKPEYTTSATLTSSSVSVAIADTNAPEGTTEGWLLTQDGLKFKITGGDETNLLLEFYADLKGPQGESGAELEIDDSGTSATKVWSSQKVASELAQAGKTYYQHNVFLYATRSSYKTRIGVTIINNDSTPFTAASLIKYFKDNEFSVSHKYFTNVSGVVYIGQNYYAIGVGCYSSGGVDYLFVWGTNDGDSGNYEYFAEGGFQNICDTVITL